MRWFGIVFEKISQNYFAMKRFIFLLCGLSGLLLVNCSAPKNLLKLQPQSDKTSWFYGQEFTGDSVFGVIAKVAFDQIDRPWYTFDCEITNRSNMDYLVDPSLFFIVPFNGRNEQIGDTIYVQNPETKIMELDKNLAVNEARRKNQLGITLLAAGIDIATGIAVLSDDNPRNDNLRTDLLLPAIASGEANKFESINLNELRDTWRSSTLRKTTLEKGFTMHGKILAPIVENAAYIQLNIPVDNEIIRINFMQVQFAP